MLTRFLMGCAALALATGTQARILDPSKPEDALEIQKRTGCGAKDGEPAVYYGSGKVYSRVEGEPDRPLFNGEGMNIRQCVAVNDATRGKGYRHVSREVMFFTDPKTGQIVRQWANPWTGETVDVMQIANDPVNARPSFELPAIIKDEIAARYPTYTAPPPGDDPRPNATTWAVFKDMVDMKRKAIATHHQPGHQNS
jgi:Protein of unknown function (DUF1838)